MLVGTAQWMAPEILQNTVFTAAAVRKAHLFEPFYTNIPHFTKTGSGHT